MSFTCPKCWRTSYHPEDEQWGYCGACHDFTGGYGYGDQRHRSSSTPAGQERDAQTESLRHRFGLTDEE